jgi:hypothetical protein
VVKSKIEKKQEKQETEENIDYIQMQRNIRFDARKNITKVDITRYNPSMEYISPIHKKKLKHLIIMIRGHVRDSFTDPRLKQLIQELAETYNIEVYIHTWNILQSDKSWRNIVKIDTPVTETMIQSYFSIPIKKIIIEDEDSIQLIGNTEGNIGTTSCPIICWKNMWYGMYQIMKQVYNDSGSYSETTILNIRFDIFTNRNRMFTIQSIKKRIEENFNKYLRKNMFISNEPVIGIDNLILGSIYSMRQLINHFHNDLDSILKKYPEEIHQEYIVYKENGNTI